MILKILQNFYKKGKPLRVLYHTDNYCSALRNTLTVLKTAQFLTPHSKYKNNFVPSLNHSQIFNLNLHRMAPISV
jgi:hypothetical protein